MASVFEIIRSRASMRGPFDSQKPVSDADLEAVLEAARWAPTAHNMQNFEVVVVDDPSALEAIRSIRRPPDETFVRENYEHLSFTEEEWARKKVGILGTMFPEAWRDPDFRLSDFTAEQLEAMSRPMAPAPILLVVLYDPRHRAPASEGDFLGIISLGCVMQNLWIAAEACGLGLQIVSSLSHDPEVRDILGVPDQLQIAFSCRLGYPLPQAAPRLRVRRDVADFTHHNRYGS